MIAWPIVPLDPLPGANYPANGRVPLNRLPSTANSTTLLSGTATDYTTYSASLANWGGGGRAGAISSFGRLSLSLRLPGDRRSSR